MNEKDILGEERCGVSRTSVLTRVGAENVGFIPLGL